MNNYLVKKLGEEGSEVAQAAFKVLLHQDKRSRQVLLSEMADMMAMLQLAVGRMGTQQRLQMARMVGERIEREVKKGKA